MHKTTKAVVAVSAEMSAYAQAHAEAQASGMWS